MDLLCEANEIRGLLLQVFPHNPMQSVVFTKQIVDAGQSRPKASAWHVPAGFWQM
jgi:hypothetical protein